MYLQKNYLFLILLFVTIINFSCKEEMPDIDDCPIGEDFGLVKVAPSSLEYLTYKNIQRAIFVDSLENELVFHLDTIRSGLKIYDRTKVVVCNDMLDSIEYDYEYEAYHARLVAENHNLALQQSLFVKSVYNDTLMDLVFFDFFNTNVRKKEFPTSINTIYNYIERVLDVKIYSISDINYPYQLPDNSIPSIIILNRTFYDVFYGIRNDGNLPSERWYNEQIGIVAFRDLDNTLWRFERFE